MTGVSLGTSRRDKRSEISFLGTPFVIERIGTDGDRRAFVERVRALDGQVDCFGVGGMDVYLHALGRRYAFREPLRMMSAARQSPWVDGSGLKHTLERSAVNWLQEQGIVDFRRSRVLVMSAVDRFGMAEAISVLSPSVVFGDIMFSLGLPVPIRSWRAIRALAPLLMPVITRLPFQWFYPTGERQERNTPRFEASFSAADVIAGDWHFIRRYMPLDLSGKIVLTQSSRKDETALLRERGAELLITTTPTVGGEAYATNVMEAVLVALSGRRPEELTPADYLGTLSRLRWRPGVVRLQSP
ncbi:MAG TPA: quinate 5-dehydrogenase [Chthonomonadales bacterium]|nr:quinate 5-dehydrogenase [Chthonomonadales bacterium]